MSLLDGFENRKVDIMRPTSVKGDYGESKITRTKVGTDVQCRIDFGSGTKARLLQGEQGKTTGTLFCDRSVDVRLSDKIVNVRNIETGAVDNVDLNGVLVPVEYEVTWISNPGSEDDHLEVTIQRNDGQTMV